MTEKNLKGRLLNFSDRRIFDKISMRTPACSRLYMISRMGRVPGAMGEGTFLHLTNQKFRFFQTQNFQRMLKMQ